jgi:type III secretion protein T
MLVAVAAELLIGMLIALPAAIFLEVLPNAGRLIDLTRGAMMAEQLLPGFERRTSPLESISFLIVMFCLFSLRGYRALVAALYQSYAVPGIQLGAVISGDMALRMQEPARLAVSLVFSALQAACLFAGPALAVLLLLEVSLMILSRVLPRINTAGEMAGIKLVGGVVLFGLLFSPERLQRCFALLNLSPFAALLAGGR